MPKETISHYRIVKKLGAGGMGEVYLAEDTSLERTVALKILPVEFATDHDRMRRFVREAKAASAVKHDRVAHIYEIGEADGVHFISMEYVEGECLSNRIGRGTLKIPEIVEIGIEIADALSEAESKGITHRDIKPANIMLTEKGHVKLLDFGLARIESPRSETAEGADSPTASRTQLGLALGTLPYMSPEQALGRTIDHRSDIFSLGVVLYQMVTNRLPFSGSGSVELVDHILHEDPAAPSLLNHQLPPELERIIRKCLEKNPERRYQTAHDLRNDLERFKMDSSTKAAAPLPKKSNKVAAIAAVFLILASIAIFFVYRSVSHREPIDSIAVLPFSTGKGDADLEYLGDGITETLINNLSQLSGLKVMSRSSVFRYKGQEMDAENVGSALNVKAVLNGRISTHKGSLMISMELVDAHDNRHIWGAQYNGDSSDALLLQQEISRDVLDHLKVQITEPERQHVAKQYTGNSQAYQLYLKGRFFWYESTEDGLRKAVECFKQAIEQDPGYALAYAGLADSYNALGVNYMLPSEEMFPKAKAAALKALQLDPALAEAHIALGVHKLFYEWDWPGAEAEARLAKELSPRYSKSIELQTDNSAHFYCYYLDVLGHPEDAIAEQKKALLIDPRAFVFYAEMGWSYYVARQYDQSISQAQKAIQMDPSMALAYLALGNSYRAKGMLNESVAQLKKAYDLMPNDPNTIAEVAYGYAAAGKRDEAMKLLDELKRRSETQRIDPGNIAIAYIGIGDKDQAFAWLQKAYDVRSQWLTWVKMEPKYDPLRSDPRFQELQRKVGLPL